MNLCYTSYILVGIILVAGLSAPVSAEIISLTPAAASIIPGSSATFLITMDSAQAGISGYHFRISLSNPNIAEITGVTCPSWVTINETVGVPSDSVTVAGVDLGEAVQASASNIPFGSVTVRGDSVGSSNIVIDVLKLDTDEGTRLNMSVYPVTLIVKSTSGGGGGGGGGGSSGDSGSYSSTTSTTVTTTQATSQPTTAVQETLPTSMPTSGQVTRPETQGTASAVTDETTAVPAVPAESASPGSR
jgi:hypothetical protein